MIVLHADSTEAEVADAVKQLDSDPKVVIVIQDINNMANDENHPVNTMLGKAFESMEDADAEFSVSITIKRRQTEQQ